MHKAVYLDKNGTLVEDPDPGYVHKIEDFKLLPGVIQGIKKLSNDFIFIVVTNQSGIGRGIHSEEDMHKFDGMLTNELKRHGIEIKKIYYCPHIPEDLCDCRKPSTKYIKQAAREFNIDLKSSWVIGDHPGDVQLGSNAGTRTIYMLTGHGSAHMEDLRKNGIKPDFIANNFLEAANFIIKNSKTK